MTGLYIFFGIVLLIVLALTVSITATIVYESQTKDKDGIADYKISYGIFKVFPPKEKKKNVKKPKKTNNKKIKKKTVPETKTADKEPKTPDKQIKTQTEKPETQKKSAQKKPTQKKEKSKKELFDIETIKALIVSALKPFGGIFSSARIKSLYINCVAGGEDAAKVALNYGLYCAGIYSLTSWLAAKRSTGVKEIRVTADFDKTETYIFMRMKIKLTLGHAIFHFLWFIKEFAKNRRSTVKTDKKGKEN